MNTPAIRYIQPVFRPPSEAESLILPVTNGCSWNSCTFCEMYTEPQKAFRPRDEEEVFKSIQRCGEDFGDSIKRVFLADGVDVHLVQIFCDNPLGLGIQATAAQHCA